ACRAESFDFIIAEQVLGASEPDRAWIIVEHRVERRDFVCDQRALISLESRPHFGDYVREINLHVGMLLPRCLQVAGAAAHFSSSTRGHKGGSITPAPSALPPRPVSPRHRQCAAPGPRARGRRRSGLRSEAV